MKNKTTSKKKVKKPIKKAANKKKTVGKKTEKRLSIPEPVKLKVWSDSGGRCEFRGCNKPLWYNELTFSNSNFAQLAHIIGASEDGPRGGRESKILETNPNNILLMCGRDHKEVDDNPDFYTVEILQEMKKEHEERIKAVTEITFNRKTEPFILKCNIDTRIVDIGIDEARATLLRECYYPSGGKVLDLTTGKGDGESDFWSHNAKQIKESVEQFKNKGLDGRAQHVSVFALAPIPLLMVLGQHLADTTFDKVELYQRHRDTQDWNWKTGTRPLPEFNFKKPNTVTKGNNVALVISLSDTVHQDKYPDLLKSNTDVYEITIDSPSPLFLKEKTQISKFEVVFRRALNEIQAHHGMDCIIHLLPAMPAPIAIKCGMTLLPKKDVTLKVYDFNKAFGGMRNVLTIG